MITHELLTKLFDYNPENGLFICKTPISNKVDKGDIAGWISNTNYRMIQIHGKRYVAHRLAWFYVYGKWPVNQLDHINGDRQDNRINNLREVTNAQNSRWKPKNKNNKAGYKGVCFNKKSKKHPYQAFITFERKNYYLGKFKTPEQAAFAYNIKAKELFKEFAYLNKIN